MSANRLHQPGSILFSVTASDSLLTSNLLAAFSHFSSLFLLNPED